MWLRLLALADLFSAHGEQARAWRAMVIAERAAYAAGRRRFLAEVVIHRGILPHRKGDIRGGVPPLLR